MILPLGALADRVHSKVLRFVCIAVACLWMLTVQLPGMMLDMRSYMTCGITEEQQLWIPRHSALAFSFPRSVSLIRDWSRQAFYPDSLVESSYDGPPGEPYVKWLLSTPHQVIVPPYPTADRMDITHYAMGWIYDHRSNNLVDAWWWYWLQLGLPPGWTGLAVLMLVLTIISLCQLLRMRDETQVSLKRVSISHSLMWIVLSVWLLSTTWFAFETVANMRAERIELQLGESIILRSYDVDQRAKHPGDALDLILYWQAGGDAPTNAWEPEQVVRDAYYLTIPPDTPPGNYRVLVGMYELESGTRLPITGPDGTAIGDHVELSTVCVKD
ncbi:MAG: hypothetical protein GXY52_05150 [Chloroflexi bacterium]|nr:hypothetical protein [Chloroflexota bacterium]